MQFAVFVDAGYLLAEGGKLIAGAKIPRSHTEIDIAAFLAVTGDIAAAKAPGIRLLRIYWYDGLVRGGGLTANQQRIAAHDNVKLRLGMVNSRGQQKEVDALIVTDLVDLARNRSITDAILITGDGDIRIGVQIAQSHGVRVHLVGVAPAQENQSPELRAEADTLQQLHQHELAGAITVTTPVIRPSPVSPRPDPASRPPLAATSVQEPQPATAAYADAVETIVQDILAQETDLPALLIAINTQGGNIPAEIDRPALSRLGQLIGRSASYQERAAFRDEVARAVRTSVEEQQ